MGLRRGAGALTIWAAFLLVPAAAAQAQDSTLQVWITGNGGVSGSGIACGLKGSVCKASYVDGTTVTLTAEPSPSTVFAGWTGPCAGSGPSCTFDVVQASVVTATFRYLQVVDVTLAGGGHGTVVSTPSGVRCGAVCAAAFPADVPITLEARPAPGSTFVGWSGYCKGTAPCQLKQTYGTMPVIATFQQSSGGGLSVSVKSGAVVSQLGASVRRTAAGRVITVKLGTTKAAALRVQVWRGKKLLGQSRLTAQPGPVTVKLKLADGYPAGQYDVWAYVNLAGEKQHLVHWKVIAPA